MRFSRESAGNRSSFSVVQCQYSSHSRAGGTPRSFLRCLLPVARQVIAALTKGTQRFEVYLTFPVRSRKRLREVLWVERDMGFAPLALYYRVCTVEQPDVPISIYTPHLHPPFLQTNTRITHPHA